MLKITDTTWNTRIDESHLTQTSNPISFSDIDYSNPTQTRRKGVEHVSQDKDVQSHLDRVVHQMANKIAQGKEPLDVPMVVEKNPFSPGKPWRLVLGHHRLRALMNHGYTSRGFFLVSFPPDRPGRIAARKFSLFNNDHEVSAKPNCHETVTGGINELFQDLIREGMDINKDKRAIKKAVKKDAKKQFGNNYTDNQIDRLITGWYDTEGSEESHTTSKYKAYSPADARRKAHEFLGIPVPAQKGTRSLLPSQGHFVITIREDDINLSQALGWARKIKARDHDLRVHLVMHTTTGKIVDDEWLLKRRVKITAELEDLRESLRGLFKKDVSDVLQKANVNLIHFPMDAIRDDFDTTHFLPQICWGNNKENENQLIAGPW